MAFEPNLVWNEELQLWEHWDEEGEHLLGCWTPEEYKEFMEAY